MHVGIVTELVMFKTWEGVGPIFTGENQRGILNRDLSQEVCWSLSKENNDVSIVPKMSGYSGTHNSLLLRSNFASQS